MGREKPRLGTVRETLYIPLCARAVETARNRPCCGTHAEEIAASID
ncbi:hypothetical protein [Streptomyces sp. YPW6]